MRVTCGRCEQTHFSLAEVRQCYGALPDALVDGSEQDGVSIAARGENYYLTETAKSLYNFHQQEMAALDDVPVKEPTPITRKGGKIHLSCTYAEKDEVKRLGARWDQLARRWYVPAGVDSRPFTRWMRAAS